MKKFLRNLKTLMNYPKVKKVRLKLKSLKMISLITNTRKNWKKFLKEWQKNSKPHKNENH